jgi:hypothetical protein
MYFCNNIGTHLKGIETSFQVIPLFLKSFHFWASYITFRNFLQMTTDYSKNNKTTLKNVLCFFWPKSPLIHIRMQKNFTKFIAIDTAVLERSKGLHKITFYILTWNPNLAPSPRNVFTLTRSLKHYISTVLPSIISSHKHYTDRYLSAHSKLCKIL